MVLTGSIPRELGNKVRGELESGEHILWMGQPIPRFFTAASIGSFLFAIPWTAFAVFWMWGACGGKLPDLSKGVMELLFPLFGLPFVLIGLAMLSVPLWMYRRAFRTVYVITDRRAITFEAGWNRAITIRSYPPARLQNIFRREKRDGTGDVIFGQEFYSDAKGRQGSTEYGFLNIREPKTAENMLKQLAAQTVEM
ncbi:MAG: hypothetical protein GX902_08820 [Lentisphaerae bacterium]|nr:hypothetical protein [Lentisphaerota bacterium]